MKQYFLALLILNLSACSSMQTVNIDQAMNSDPPRIQPGDRVEVTTFDREQLEFTVAEVTDDGLRGEFGFIPFDNISRLRVRVPGSGDNDWTAWVLGVLAVVGLVALISSADSVSVCSGTPCPPE